jgi:murein DD-endopeptidase MepM/ murein hydrolase activator NlpD
VRVGQLVARGRTIGRIGNTGHSFGAHLHFEIRKGGEPVDPQPYLK